jgi:hypothetical protein
MIKHRCRKARWTGQIRDLNPQVQVQMLWGWQQYGQGSLHADFSPNLH